MNYEYSLAGNMDTDVAVDAGFFALSQVQAGKELAYTFTPNNDAVTKAVGTLIVDPLDFGGDTNGETMVSDFEFSLVGAPVYTYAP